MCPQLLQTKDIAQGWKTATHSQISYFYYIGGAIAPVVLALSFAPVWPHVFKNQL